MIFNKSKNKKYINKLPTKYEKINQDFYKDYAFSKTLIQN